MLFVSSFCYCAAKLAGDNWDEVRTRELANLDTSLWPGLRTVGQVRRLGEEASVYVDGGTLITKARSRAAGVFLRSDADVWLTVDDDIFATADVLAQLVRVARHTKTLVAAPAILRNGAAFNFRRATPPVEHLGACAFALVDMIGFGLAAIHRELVHELSVDAPQVGKAPHDFPALFLETVTAGGDWIGEDFNFCRSAARIGYPVHVLCNAPVEHCGRSAKLSDRLELLVAGEQAAAKIDTRLLSPDAVTLQEP